VPETKTTDPAMAGERGTMPSTFTIRITRNGRHEDTIVSRRAFTREEAETMAAERAALLGAKDWRVIAN
jgi:hypothetical protein